MSIETTTTGSAATSPQTTQSRRSILQKLGATPGALLTAAFLSTTYRPQAVAAESSTTEPTIWVSGKAPKVPGAKPKDKSDTAGTKKDPSFLRSISDCRSGCESAPGADGYARSKEDCLSDCQDICCKTYEQCTFNIVPRM